MNLFFAIVMCLVAAGITHVLYQLDGLVHAQSNKTVAWTHTALSILISTFMWIIAIAMIVHSLM